MSYTTKSRIIYIIGVVIVISLIGMMLGRVLNHISDEVSGAIGEIGININE